MLELNQCQSPLPTGYLTVQSTLLLQSGGYTSDSATSLIQVRLLHISCHLSPVDSLLERYAQNIIYSYLDIIYLTLINKCFFFFGFFLDKLSTLLFGASICPSPGPFQPKTWIYL